LRATYNIIIKLLKWQTCINYTSLVNTIQEIGQPTRRAGNNEHPCGFGLTGRGVIFTSNINPCASRGVLFHSPMYSRNINSAQRASLFYRFQVRTERNIIIMAMGNGLYGYLYNVCLQSFQSDLSCSTKELQLCFTRLNLT
jgi:hypothetical protein